MDMIGSTYKGDEIEREQYLNFLDIIIKMETIFCMFNRFSLSIKTFPFAF